MPARLSRCLRALALVVLLALAGCSVPPGFAGQLPSGEQATPTTATAAVAPTVTAAEQPTAAAAAPASPAAAQPTPLAATDPTYKAIQALIQKANDEQVQAFASGDPTLMQDTATAGYYAELAQINDQLAAAGVATIKLVKIEWGDVALTGPTTATATTYETWQTTWADKSTDQSRDRNVYTLVQEQGAWKIQADEHPDSSAPGPSGQATPAPRGQPPSTAPAAPSDLSQSHNWSGYAATGGKFTSVTGTWTIPQSDGDGNAGTSASWVGIGGVSSRDLIQAGTQQLTGGTGTVRYSAWVEILPQSSRPVPFKVGPGDSVTVTITQQQGSQWLIAFKNNTSGEAYQTNLEYQSSLSSAEWIHEAPSGRRAILPLDDFGQVHFSAGSAVRDGESLSISQLGAQAITMIDAGGNSVATPSSLTADGGGFSITQSPPSQMAPGNAAPRIRPRRVPSGAGGA